MTELKPTELKMVDGEIPRPTKGHIIYFNKYANDDDAEYWIASSIIDVKTYLYQDDSTTTRYTLLDGDGNTYLARRLKFYGEDWLTIEDYNKTIKPRKYMIGDIVTNINGEECYITKYYPDGDSFKYEYELVDADSKPLYHEDQLKPTGKHKYHNKQ